MIRCVARAKFHCMPGTIQCGEQLFPIVTVACIETTGLLSGASQRATDR